MLLVVDDDADVRFMVGLLLEDEGLPFEEARSGPEALERAAGAGYDAILLDQRMPPGPDGIDVAATLRDRGVTSPIVLYSAYLDPTVSARARTLGLETVEKGDPVRLMAVVRGALAVAAA